MRHNGGIVSFPRCLECLHPNAQQVPQLLCLPHAGGSAQAFVNWQTRVHDIAICGLHLPGHGKRFSEPASRNLHWIVTTLADELGSEIHEPFAVFGHSMGAFVGFELAREIKKRHGIEPVHLVVAGVCAPHLYQCKALTYNLPDDKLIEEVRRLNGTPVEVLENADTMKVFLPLLRADLEAIQTYQYKTGELLSCPITAYGGVLDESVSLSDMEAWSAYTRGTVKVRMFPGDHFFVDSQRQQVLNALKEDLKEGLTDCVLRGLTSKT